MRKAAAVLLALVLLCTASVGMAAEARTGGRILFGHYPQTDEGDDNTLIQWYVLAVEGRRALVISRFGLDAQPYNISGDDTTWADCTLRAWLNDDFLNRAFT